MITDANCKAMAKSNVSLAPIERITLNELAYVRLKGALLSGRIEPGSTFTLRGLANDLGTSVMPVREAVTRLTAETALAVLPNRGIVVPALEGPAAEEVWELRLLLEGHASQLAAERANDAAIAEIRGYQKDLRRALEEGDIHRVLESNNQFQFAIYRAANSPQLLQFIEVLRMKSVPHCTAAIRALLRDRPPYFRATLKGDAALLSAITNHDGARASKVKREDLRAFRAYVNSVAAQRR